MSTSNILVTGASGHLGKLVVEGLLARGVNGIIATTRTPETLAEFAARGVDVRAADFDDTSGLEKAFEGADTVFLISSSAFEKQVEQHKAAIDTAKKVGVQRILYTSGPNAEASPAVTSAPHWATEQYIFQSGLDYTILRNYPYYEVLFLTLPLTIKSGQFLGSVGDGRIAYVARQDCADAAVGALLADNLSRATVNITGPKAYSYQDVADALGPIVGKTIDYVELSPDELVARLASAGFEGFWPQALLSFDLAYKQGDTATVTNAVQTLSGHEPQDLTSFLEANKTNLLQNT